MGKTLTKEKQSDQGSLNPLAEPEDDQASIAKLLTHPFFLQSNDPLLSTMIEPLKNILQDNQNNGTPAQLLGSLKNRLNQVLPQGQGRIDAFKKVNESNKTICWKVIPMNEVYFRCLDCEVGEDNSNVFLQCKECFEKANHSGHRVTKSRPTSDGYTCDCGVLDGIRLEGTCPVHLPKQQTIEEALADFPQDVRQKFSEAFRKIIYGIICYYEIGEKARSKKIKDEIDSWSQQYQAMLLSFYTYVSGQLSKSFNLVVERVLRSAFEAPNNRVWHDCNDLKDEYLAKNSELEPPRECSCTVLGCILRFSKYLNKDCQSSLKALLIESCKEETSSRFLNREICKYAYFLIGDPSSSNEIKKRHSELDSAIRNEVSIEENDVQCLDNLLGSIKRVLKEHQMSEEQCDAIFRLLYPLANFLTIGSKASEIALYDKNLLDEYSVLLSDFQTTSIYPNEIRLGLFQHNIDYEAFRLQLIVERVICMVLDHGLKMMGDLSADRKVPAFKNISKEWQNQFQKAKAIQDHQRLYKRQINPLSGLEKTLCLMIIHYLQDNITKESVEGFFKTFFPEIYQSNLASNVVKGPLTTMGLMRFTEIIKTTNLGGYSLYFSFKNIFDIDVVGIQLMTLLVRPQELFSLFATSFFSYAQDLIDFCLSYHTVTIESLKNHPHSRQMILLLEDFLEFFIFIMNDEISLMNLNLRSKVSRKRPDFPPERVIKKVFVNILAEMTWFDVGLIKEVATNFISQEVWTPVDSIIAKIVIRDDEQNKIKLKKEYESELDPYIFYRQYYDQKTRQNDLTSQEMKTQDRDIVSGKFYTDLSSYFTDIQQNIFQSKLPEFVSYIVINFSKEVQRLLQPALKLVLFNLQVVNAALENPNSNTENLQKKVEKTYLTKDFSQSLNKILADGNYKECEKCINNIQSLIKQLSSRAMMRQQSLGPAQEEEEKKEVITAEKKRQQAKEKMEKLKEQFAKKQAAFAEKNEDLRVYKDTESPDQVIESSPDRRDIICQYCLDKIDELSSDEYGVPLYIEFTNNFYNTEEEILFQKEDYTDLSKAKWWPVISSCHHSYHRKCFDKHCQSSRGPQNVSSQFFTNELEVQCALCKKLSNSFLVMNTDLISQDSENSSERYMLIIQELLALRVEGLNLLKGPNNKQNNPYDTLIQEILKRGYEYFVESFHLHKNAHGLSENFELHLNFFKTLKHCPTIKNQTPKKAKTTFFSSLDAKENCDPQSIANNLLFDILLKTCSLANTEEHSAADEQAQIIKEYLVFNIAFLSRDHQVSSTPIPLTDLASFYKENKEIRSKANNELAFPMQKLLLAYYLNQCILNPSKSAERFEFCKLLSSADNSSEKLNLLLKHAGFSISFDQLIEEALLLRSESEPNKALLSEMLTQMFVFFKNGRFRLAPQFHSSSLPQTYLDFSQRYLYKKCDLCHENQPNKTKSVCLLCGECLCDVTCNPNIQRQPAGNLSMHAAQYHMGIGLFFMTDLHLILSSKWPAGLIHVPGSSYVSELGESIYNILAKQENGSSVPKSTDFKKFTLNKKMFDKLEKIVMSHSVGQEIFENAPLNLHTYFVNAKF